jgi:MFS family permease
MTGTVLGGTRKPRRARPGGRLVVPLRHGPFRLLFIGQAASRTGDVVFQVGLAAYALRHGSPALLGYSLVAQSCGTIAMLLVGGALADRFGARRTVIAADAIRFLAVGGAAVVVATGSASVPAMAACALLLGLGDGAFEPAFTVAFMELLPADELMAANSLQSMVARLANIGGAALGGVVVALGSGATPMVLDAATFAVSLACVAAARRWPRRIRTAAPSRLWRDIADGARYVRGQRWLLGALIGFGIHVALLLAPIKILVPLVVQHRLHGGGGDYGVLLAAQGIGALAGGIFAGARREPGRPGVYMFVLMAVTDLSYVIVAASSNLAVSAAASMIGGASIAMAVVVWASLMQRNVPADMIGRTSSFDWLLSVGAAPLSLAVMPTLIGVWPAASVLGVLALLGAATSLFMLLLPDLRRVTWLDRSNDKESEPADG